MFILAPSSIKGLTTHLYQHNFHGKTQHHLILFRKFITPPSSNLILCSFCFLIIFCTISGWKDAWDRPLGRELRSWELVTVRRSLSSPTNISAHQPQLWLFKVDLLGPGVCLGVGGWLTTAAVPRVASLSPATPTITLLPHTRSDQGCRVSTGCFYLARSTFPPTVIAWKSQGQGPPAKGSLEKNGQIICCT